MFTDTNNLRDREIATKQCKEHTKDMMIESAVVGILLGALVGFICGFLVLEDRYNIEVKKTEKVISHLKNLIDNYE